MNIKSLLLGSAAALVAVSGARAADAVEVVAEPEPAEYVRVCDTYGTGYFYIPGTETCLRIGGYVRYDIGAGNGPYGGVHDVVDFSDEDGGTNDTYWKNTRFTLRTWTGTETELGTLSTFTETRWNWGSTGGDFDDLGGYGGMGGKGTSLNFAWIQLGGFRVGKDETAWMTFSGYAGGVIADDLIPYGLYDTNLVSYTFDAGNGFSAIVSLETGSDSGDYWGSNAFLNSIQADGKYSIDSYVPHIVGGVKYAGGWGSASLMGAYDSTWEEFTVKGRVDVNVNDALSLFVMAAYGSYDIDEGTAYSFYKPWNGHWAAWAGGSYKFNEKATFNLQASWDEGFGSDFDALLPGTDFDGDWAIAANVDYEIVKDFHIIPEITYTDFGMVDAFPGSTDGDDEGFGGWLRFQRNF